MMRGRCRDAAPNPVRQNYHVALSGMAADSTLLSILSLFSLSNPHVIGAGIVIVQVHHRERVYLLLHLVPKLGQLLERRRVVGNGLLAQLDSSNLCV